MPHIKAKENNNKKLYISNARGVHTITAYGTTLRDHRNNNNKKNNNNSNEKWVNRVGLKTQKFAAVEKCQWKTAT